jgi:DDE superfamily endonuclease
VLTTMACRYGRSPRGQRACVSIPFGGWQRLSVLGAIGMDGFMAAMSIEVAHRQRYLRGLPRAGALLVLHKRKPDAVLVMDNLRAHKTSEVQAVLERSGFAYRFLPAYSLELNPVEKV